MCSIKYSCRSGVHRDESLFFDQSKGFAWTQGPWHPGELLFQWSRGLFLFLNPLGGIDWLAGNEHDESWYTLNAEGLSDARRLIDVDFDDQSPPFKLLAEGLQFRCDSLAWSAPGRSKLGENG